MEWVTRAGVRTDRASMIWMIRKFIDADATIVILPEAEVLRYAEAHSATPFHHPQAPIRHMGTRTGFDALRVAYDLSDPALALMAMVMRGAETSDKGLTQWSAGIAALTSGMRKLAESDEAFIAVTAPMWDGLYQWCQDQLAMPGAAARTAER